MFSRLIRLAHRKGLVPRLSETERQALEAGTVWADGELFSGRPDFRKLLAEAWPQLSERERAFLDGPVEEVCKRVDVWELDRTRRLPEEVWAYLKRERFFGLALPESWGGHGFSALALSTIFGKLASHSLPLSAIVLIPNSVGPGELLLEYGTEAQKRHFLPRLARGDEIPCFALTEPEAGSDAASLTSHGEVFRGADGELALRLEWDKRYITLAPHATLLGLAVRLRDPENLLGRAGERSPKRGSDHDPDLGITVVLVSTDLPGVEIGRFHDPMGIPFPNGPTRGRDVVVPVNRILGGPEHAGKGWRMLMEALSGGRAISLPAQSAGGAKKVARIAGAYAAVRHQFGIPIGRFEGIEEPLARIAGSTYVMEAARKVTCSAVDHGHRPAVLSAVVKYQETELMRSLVLDAMDILGGAAICRGPSNPLGDGYRAAPIGITVEGANILTRSLIVFGQGAMRCHPYSLREVRALQASDPRELRRAVFGHAVFFLRNLLRESWRGLTRGRFVRSPVPGPTARYFRKLAWASTRFAVLTDLALLGLGSKLKFREKLSGRFADALSWMYLGFCTLARFEGEGRQQEDLPLMRWGAETALARIQEAFEGIARHFEGPLVGPFIRTVGRALLRLNPQGTGPSDRLGAEVARVLLRPGAQRDRLTEGVFVPGEDDPAVGRLERAFRLTAEAAAAPDDEELARQAAEARRAAVQVDEYSAAEYLGGAEKATETRGSGERAVEVEV